MPNEIVCPKCKTIYVEQTSVPGEIVNIPASVSGPSSGYVGQSLSFTASGSTSSLGHSVQYRFDWGDGTACSNWGSATQSHTYNATGTFNIKAQARCSTHTSVESDWSGNLKSVSISAAPTGDWTDIVNKAIKVNASDPLHETGRQIMGVPIAKGSTTYFLIAPKEFGVPYSGNSMLNLRIINHDSLNPAMFSFRILELDANNNATGYEPKISLGTGGTYGTYLKNFTVDKYNSGIKFLLIAVEPGRKATAMDFSWW